MTGIAIAIAVLGIMAMRRAHRRCHGYYGYGWHGPFGHGWHGHHGWHGRHHGRSRMMLHALFMRIDATPAQERAIVAEIEKLQDRLRTAKSGLHDSRGDLAAALRGPVLDDAALGAVLGRVDSATGQARTAVLEALRAVHGLLDDRQRGQVADLLDHGGGWWRGFGPYR
jgi:Spy/CpxP family protein refolding chaperone